MVDALITPKGQLDLLSKHEVALLKNSSEGEIGALLRKCALAVLSCGSSNDDGHYLLKQYKNFSIDLVNATRGVQLQLHNAPEDAFVDGEIIQGIRDHLFSVLRDIVYVKEQMPHWKERGESTTDMVFKTLRNARALRPGKRPNLVVCWGGHAISGYEYDYSKEVGYRLGLRGMDICTGCGTGAMKGPMKGAAIAHAKQRINRARYIGISEPGIIASEAPNAIVNQLIIMPDIEKRLEAFVRMAHGIIVFPGGAGTAEEILYLLGIMLNEKNKDVVLPVILTGPEKSAGYFEQMDKFIRSTLGDEASSLYEIIIGDAIQVGKVMKENMEAVYENRKNSEDAFFFNWLLDIEQDFQKEFDPTHANMGNLNLHPDQSTNKLAANLRRAFSGIVAGNVKANSIDLIQKHGPYELDGDPAIMQSMDILLNSFVEQKRMKIAGDYTPCYKIKNSG